MSDSEFIDLRDQLHAYVNSGSYKSIVVRLISGDRYVVTRPSDILICPRVVFVFQGVGMESCFLFDMICNVDVFRAREG